MTFLEQIFNEYPVPVETSIWGGDQVTTFPLADAEQLITTCLQELKSDLYIADQVYGSSMSVPMPEDTITVSSARLNYAIPGNTLVKVWYDKGRNVAKLFYFPATITFRRYLRRTDLEDGTLVGDMLIYFKTYLLWKMGDKELQILNSITLDTDNGTFNLAELQRFVTEKKAKYEEMKPEILMYATVM